MDNPVGINSRPLPGPAPTGQAQPAVRTPRAGTRLAPAQPDPRLQEACRQMESLFLSYMLKELRATVQKSGFISGGQAEEIFTSLLDVEISKKMAARGGIGLSTLLMQQLGRKGPRPEGEGTV